MAANVLADAGFLVALLNRRDGNHSWAVAQARQLPPPWKTCEAALSAAVRLLGANAVSILGDFLKRGAVLIAFRVDEGVEEILRLMEKYADVPMSFADACLVRMTEALSDPVLLTTDADFRVYRRHGRRIVPCIIAG